MARPAKDRPDVRVFNEIGVIAQQTRNLMERALPASFSYASFSLLGHFALCDLEQSPAQLAETFQVTKGAITNTLQRLEADGLIVLRADKQDGRKKWARITDEGLAAYSAALAGMRPVMASLRDRFADDDFEAVLPFLAALRGWLGDNR